MVWFIAMARAGRSLYVRKIAGLEAVEAVNERQKTLLVRKLVERLGESLEGLHVALWGLAFKPNTDDMREAPSRTLMELLWQAGARVQAYDPEAMKEAPKPWEFRSKPAWQRLIVMLGGIIVNVLVGILIFIGITYFYGDSYLLKDKINEHGGFVVGAAGESIGLQTGDKIVKINGRDYRYFQELVDPNNLLADNASYTVERNGQEVIISIPPDFIQRFNRKEGLANFLWYRFPSVVEEVVPGSVAARVGLQP